MERIFIVNPTSGHGKSLEIMQYIEKKCKERRGKKMAKIYGAENVYDFSIGNPGLKPPQEVFDAIDEINHNLDPLLVHGYPSNAGYHVFASVFGSKGLLPISSYIRPHA